jgi:hypothetical protein
MWNFIKSIFGFVDEVKTEAPKVVAKAKAAEAEVEAIISSAAARVESPAKEPAKCGCGRSPTGYCVGLHRLTEEQWAVSDKNPNRVETTAQTQAETAAPQAAADQPEETKAKKTRAPKAPKADKTPKADKPARAPRAKKTKA